MRTDDTNDANASLRARIRTGQVSRIYMLEWNASAMFLEEFHSGIGIPDLE